MSRQDEERVVFEQLILSDFKTWVVTAIHACNSYHIKISNNSDNMTMSRVGWCYVYR